MDLTTAELIVFVAVTLYTDVISCSEFIGSCETTLTFSHYDTSFLLNYDGASLTDSFGKPCEAVVETKHTSYTKINICVKLYSGRCTRIFKFYYAEDPYQYYSCEQIQHEAVCKQSDAVVAEFQPWTKTAEYSENITIYVYKQTYIETPPDNKSDASDVIMAIVFVTFLVVVIIIIGVVKRRSNEGNNSRPAEDHPPRSQGNQSTSLSAEPPNYTDVMAAENRQNNVSCTTNRGTLDKTGPQVCHRLQELTIKPSAPSPSEDTIPETPPPPYPGYSQYL